MKALVWTAPRQMEIQERPVPEVQPEEVLVKVAFAGICGSELGGYLGHNALRIPPLVMGHEFSGQIAELGSEVASLKLGLFKGLKVTVNPLSCSGNSELQQLGLDQLCPSRQLLGAHRPGAFAEYVAVPVQSITPLPDDVSLRSGALTEPVGCAVRIGELAGSVADQTCLILGAGPIGILTLQVLRNMNAGQIIIADLDPERLAMGAELSGTVVNPLEYDVVKVVHQLTRGRGADVAVDAVGTAVTRQQCISATKPTGVVILSGLHEESSVFPAADIIRREIIVRGSFAYSPANFARAVSLLAEKKIGLDPWILEAPLPQGGQWFERLIEAPGNVSKVLLVP